MDAIVDRHPRHMAIEPTVLRAWTEVLDIIPGAVILVGGIASGSEILYLNLQATRMFGYERSELMGHSVDLVLPQSLGASHVRTRDDGAAIPRLGPMGAGVIVRGRRRDGTEFPVDVLLTPNGQGSAQATIAILRDMTDRQLLEDALVQARDSAVRANEVKSRFLAAASHDLRQPLQTIWSMQSVLARGLKNTEYAPHVVLVEEAVRNMDQMLSSLIDINRLEKGAIQPVIADFSLHEVLPPLRSEFGCAAAGKSLSLEIDDSHEVVRSDPTLLPVILRNLLGNAIKYTQHGVVRIRVRAEGPAVFIDIIDTGPGIPPIHLERLFDAFYQIDNPHRDQSQGVGLGLSIVQTICRLLDHSVTIHSRVGQGSTFSVNLQRGQVSEVSSGTRPAPVFATARPLGAPKVLHIEDDQGIARSMAMVLRLEGYEVISAASRDEAMEHIIVRGLRPDLILSDFQLPMGLTGDQIVAEISAFLEFKPPTIILTGDLAEQHVVKARLVADHLLPKPVDINALLFQMETLIRASACDRKELQQAGIL